MNAINCSTLLIASNYTAGIQRMYNMTAVKPYPLQTPQSVIEHHSHIPGEPKKIPPTTFVDITAMHGNFCTKFYTIVKRSNIHFITKFY